MPLPNGPDVPVPAGQRGAGGSSGFKPWWLGVIIGCIVGALLLLLLIVAAFRWRRRRRQGDAAYSAYAAKVSGRGVQPPGALGAIFIEQRSARATPPPAASAPQGYTEVYAGNVHQQAPPLYAVPVSGEPPTGVPVTFEQYSARAAPPLAAPAFHGYTEAYASNSPQQAAPLYAAPSHGGAASGVVVPPPYAAAPSPAPPGLDRPSLYATFHNPMFSAPPDNPSATAAYGETSRSAVANWMDVMNAFYTVEREGQQQAQNATGLGPASGQQPAPSGPPSPPPAPPPPPGQHFLTRMRTSPSPPGAQRGSSFRRSRGFS